MIKRCTAACAATALAVAALSQLPTFAAYVDDVGGENAIYRNLLLDTVEKYGISETSVNNDITYVYGSAGGQYCLCIWDGSISYRTILNTNQSIPENNYYKSTDYTCSFGYQFIGSPNIAAFYYNEGLLYHLQMVYTNDAGKYNSVQDQSRARYLRTDETGDTIGEQIRYIIDTELPEPTEPTEPTETTAPAFALPDNWVNTVEKTEPTFEMFTETIPTMTVPTLPEDIVSKTMLIPKILFDISRGTWFFPIFLFCIIVTLLTYFIWLR